ncbi:MAG: Superkiller protein 3 [Alectoria sarmentosa]|nr:MAG: Superkiller protein 3 [Alectoria sarmentosa]
MSGTKSALKAAKAALDANRYQDAIDQAKAVLETEADNYHANVFLGRAFEKLNQNQGSEEAYKAAIGRKDNDPLAWQGLVGLYEKQAGKKLDDYHGAAIRLAELHMNEYVGQRISNDKIRCQAVVHKYTGNAHKYGSRAQYKRSLEILLPTTTLYDCLEGRILQPAFTYSKIADIVEAEEREKINTEIGQRRTRLGAKIDQVTSEVKREVLEDSPLESLYENIINWTHDDEIRRLYEEKLLQHAYDTLIVVPTPKKAAKREQVQKMAQGLVILKHPFLLAWTIELEWKDGADIEEMDAGLLREFIALFPDVGLSKLLKGFLHSDVSPFPKPADSAQEQNEESEHNSPLSREDGLILMTEGMEESSSSILAHRIMGLMYLHLEEYEAAAATARQGLQRVSNESGISGLTLENLFDAMRIILAAALVQFQAPRHHPEAMELLENVLHRKTTDSSALIGIGLILEEQGEYVKAIDYFDRALKRTSDPKIKAEAAWCKALNGDNETSLHELEVCLPNMGGSDTRTKLLRSQTLYRVGMCIWNRDTSSKARKNREGAYAQFLASLQADLNYAPAYTILGIYYADYGRDKKRARKCFQKAFELSSSEVDAAERLAQSFARSGEWDLVEVVARRVIESGKVKAAPGSKRKGVSWPFAALGVVELNNQEYPKSIVSFQSALRSSPENYHCWVGLGESYHNSGRYIAATKAFEHAQQLEESHEDGSVKDHWFTKYMLANVKRELGQYDDAIAGYQEVLTLRPTEFGVSIALLQSLVEGAWHSIELGFFGRAAGAAGEALNVAKSVAKEHHEAFNLWKAVGDACSMFSYASAYASRLPAQVLLSLLEADIDFQVYNVLAEVDGISAETLQTLIRHDQQTLAPLQLSITAAILAHKRAIHACANDFHARAIAWYNLGWTEHRAHICSHDGPRTESKKKPLKHLKASVQAFKRAIELEAGNAEFWNSLGIVTTELNPKVSQHSFVRSLYLNDKNARVWTNLGVLYLIQNDVQLAHEAFTRAQSSDPDYAQAWLGQGLLAKQLGEVNEARQLFTHAFEIADSSSPIIKRQFAVSTFDHLLSSPLSSSTSAIQPLFALHQLRSQVSADFSLQHLSSLLAERVGDFGDAVATLDQVTSNLEAEYETSESQVVLMRFALAKADLSRAQLAERRFEAAAENAETALSLSEEEDVKNEARQKLRLSAHMTAGLAYYYQGTMDQAIIMFRSALEETQGNPDIVCLLAQVLWAKGGNEERNVAREQLFDCVENHPDHSGAIVLLGVIAVLDDDRDTIEAVTADLEGLRTRDTLAAQNKSKVAQILMIISALFPGEEGQNASEISQATTTTMLAPSQPHGWLHLAGLSDESHPAEMAVLTATKAAPPGGNLDANNLSKAYAGTRRLDDAQRAIMVAPWAVQGWEALA